jgi:Zn-dependent protease with chaperone function
MSRMRNLLKPLVMTLAVPVLAAAIGMLARSDLDARWSANLGRQLAAQRMRPDSRLLARYSLAVLCADPKTGARLPPCGTYNLYGSVVGASAMVGAFGLVFLGSLVLAANLCRASRRRLTWLFRPSLVFAATGTAAVAVLNALLVVAGVVEGATYLFGQPVERVSTSLVLVVGTAALLWAVSTVAVAFSTIRRPTLTVIGLDLDVRGQQALVDEVTRVADAVGAEPPQHLVACLVPWVSVTEVKVATLDGVASGRTLCLSLPLCRILSIDELRALLAHELAHFKKGEEAFARRVAPFHAGASRAIDRLGTQARGVRGLAVALPVAMIGFFVEAVRGDAERADQRELDADRVAAAVAGPDALASALVKVHAFAPAWDAVVGATFHAVAAGTQYVNSSALFYEIAASNAGAERLLGIGRRELGHPTDRHPALARRLAALDVDRARVAASALDVLPASPATALVRDLEAVERRLSLAEHRMMLVTGGEATELASG